MTAKSKRKTGRPKDKGLPARRREEILNLATQAFAERGFRRTDVQDIADKLDMGKGTVYRYFPSKRELFLAAVDRGMRLLRAEVYAHSDSAPDPLERIIKAVTAYLAFFDSHPYMIELFMQERAEFKDRKKPTYFQHRDANVKRWKSLFRTLIKAGRVRRVPVSRITDVISTLLYGTIFTNYFVGRKKSFHAQARDIADVVFCGILSDKERKRRRACRTA